MRTLVKRLVVLAALAASCVAHGAHDAFALLALADQSGDVADLLADLRQILRHAHLRQRSAGSLEHDFKKELTPDRLGSVLF